MNSKTTVGTIVGIEQGTKSSGKDAMIIYKYQDDSFTKRIRSSKYRANIKGEKYNVVFDSLNPSNSIVLIFQPIFNIDEETKITIGKITRIYQFNWSENKYISNYGVEFQYNANGSSFTKDQSLPPQFKHQFPDLKEGDNFNVEYWLKNPERSIIKIE